MEVPVLELKHITGYLPYDLKVEISQYEQKNVIIMKGINQYKGDFTIWSEWAGYGKTFGKRPILRPWSDLTKEIQVNGKKIIPLREIKIYKDIPLLVHNTVTGFLEVIIYEMLLQWHFDVHGLIEKGLAININTLK